MSSVDPALKRSADTTTAGRVPACSCPWTGSASIHHTSPRRSFRGGTCTALLLPVLVFEAVGERPVPRGGLSPILPPLRWSHRRIGATDLVPESVTGKAFDRVGGKIAHWSSRLFRHRLECGVAAYWQANERPGRGTLTHISMVNHIVYQKSGRHSGLAKRESWSLASEGGQACCRQESDIEGRTARDREIREDIADRRGELEAVTGARRCVRHGSVPVDDEVPVRAVRVKAYLRSASLAVRERHAATQPRAHAFLVSFARLAIDGIRIDAVAEVESCHLEPDLRIVRKSVVEAVGVLDDVHGQLRERLELEARLEPEEHVALDPEMRRELRHESRQPRARGDDQT